MPENKNQHYVSRFYLKNFSSDGKRIGIFHIPSKSFIKTGSIRTQSAEDYFYGKDSEYDKALTLTEEKVAPIIKRIVTASELPKQGSLEHRVLLSFALLARSRTKYTREHLIEGLDRLREQIRDRKTTSEIPDMPLPTEREAIEMSVQSMIELLPLGLDLHYKLIVNESSVGFITCDNPVVYYNQFLESRNPVFNNTGLINKGLQIFLPLSARHCLIMYDGTTYAIGDRHVEVIKASKLSDIEELNRLQFVNANSTVYFDSSILEEYMDAFAVRSQTYRRDSKVFMEERPVRNKPNSTIIRTSGIEVRTKLDLSFVRLQRRAARFKIKNRLFIPRSPELGERSRRLVENRNF